MEDTVRSERGPSRRLSLVARPVVVPLLAIVSALLVGALIMLISGDRPLRAYWGLFQGAFGSLGAISRTIRKATPFVLTGLSLAFGFKAGLFNIGASGQFLMGTVASVAVGIYFDGLAPYVHLPLALLAGVLGGAIWGAIPGILKVWRGAHEVITTIMLNYVASLFASWLVYAGGTQGQQPGPLSDPEAAARGISETRDVSVVIWWVLYKTAFGFEVRTVGASADAARYAGIRVKRVTVLSLAIAGSLAGLAGAVDTLGLNYKFAPEFTGSAGFEGITIALLGKTHPLGVVLSAFLMGGLYGGASKMQFDSGVAAEIIQVVQALVLVFVAAPEIVRTIYRMRKPSPEEEIAEPRVTTGWGG